MVNELPTRSAADPGYIIIKNTEGLDTAGLAAKNWVVADLDEVGTDIAVYKYDKSIYKDLVPVFDNNFVSLAYLIRFVSTDVVTSKKAHLSFVIALF